MKVFNQIKELLKDLGSFRAIQNLELNEHRLPQMNILRSSLLLVALITTVWLYSTMNQISSQQSKIAKPRPKELKASDIDLSLYIAIPPELINTEYSWVKYKKLKSWQSQMKLKFIDDHQLKITHSTEQEEEFELLNLRLKSIHEQQELNFLNNKLKE